LRLALQSPQHHQAAVAGVAGALVGAAAAAANARRGKLFRQRSSSTLAPVITVSGGALGSGSWSGSHQGDVLVVSSPLGVASAVAAAAAGRGPQAPRDFSSGSSGSSTGVVAAVSAGLAAAAAAVGGKGEGKSGNERLPLLSSAEQAAAAHNR
jgi:hypothetical protein